MEEKKPASSVDDATHIISEKFGANRSLPTLIAKIEKTAQSQIPPPQSQDYQTVDEQIQDILQSVSAMAFCLPRLIPGTPITVIFNSILYYTNSELTICKKALSWETVLRTPDNRAKMIEKQNILEAAFKEQGVDIATSMGYTDQKPTTTVGKLLAFLHISGKGTPKSRSSSNLVS
jgi:hypothetical protein